MFCKWAHKGSLYVLLVLFYSLIPPLHEYWLPLLNLWLPGIFTFSSYTTLLSKPLKYVIECLKSWSQVCKNELRE